MSMLQQEDYLVNSIPRNITIRSIYQVWNWYLCRKKSMENFKKNPKHTKKLPLIMDYASSSIYMC